MHARTHSHSRTHSLAHSPTHSPTRSLTRSLTRQALVDKNLPKGAIATLDLAVAHHGKLSSWPDLVTVSTVGRTYTVSKQAAIQRSPALKAYLSEHGKNLPDLKEQWAAYLAATAGQPASQGADNDVARRACLDLLGTATVLAGCLANHGVACKLALGAGDDLPPQLQLIKSCLVHRGEPPKACCILAPAQVQSASVLSTFPPLVRLLRTHVLARGFREAQILTTHRRVTGGLYSAVADFLNGMRFAGKLRRAQADSESTEAELLAICAEAAEDYPAYSAESMAALIGVGRTTAIGAGAVEVTIRGAKLSKSATNGDLRRFVDDFEHYPHTLRRGPDEASLTFASAEEAARAVDELSGKALMGVDVELEVAQADAPEEDEGEVQDK